MEERVSTSGDDSILCEMTDGVATVTINRPDAHNSLTPEHFARLGEQFDGLAEDPDCRVMILTGKGAAFCSGADLTRSTGAARLVNEGPITRAQLARKTIAPALSLHRLPKPTIAAVNGVAAGGGCNLALGCDIVFAAESARFAQVFVNRGLALDYGGLWLLPRLVGLQRAKDIAFRGDLIGAREAVELGLALEVVADDDLMSRASDYAKVLASKPPIALSLIKSGINRSSGWSFEEGLEYEAESQATCLGSQDFRAAMQAWIKKSEGQYHGK